MATGMLSVGITGIQAAQLGLQVTQHNIANANTEGYNRQSIHQSAGTPRLSGSGYFGNGTIVDTVRRTYDQYLVRQTFNAQAAVSQSDAQLSKLEQLDNMFGDANSGLSSALQDFFSGVQQVAANPSLISARQTMVSTSQVLVSRVNSLAGRLNELYDSVNGEIVSEVDLVNNYAKQIAALNDQIIKAQAATSQPPNDLLDQRDQLVGELNKHVKITTVEEDSGAFNVFLGKGQQLVVGSLANTLSCQNSTSNPERIVVALKSWGGGTNELPESVIEGGALGGIMAFRTSLDKAANQLGAVTAALALTFNAQNSLGQDLYGQNATTPEPSGFQAEYFQISGPKVLASSTAATPLTASFLPPAVDAANGGFKTGLTGSDYMLRNSGGSLTLTRLSDNTVVATDTTMNGLNAKIAGEGFQIALSDPSVTVPTANVNYLIQPTRDIAASFKLNEAVAADPKRIAASAPALAMLDSKNAGSLKVSQGEIRFDSSIVPTSPAGYDLGQFPLVVKYSSATGEFGLFDPATGIAKPVPITIEYEGADPVTPAGGASSFTRLESSTTGPAVKAITINGFRVEMSGMPADGDSFSIGANTNNTADSRNITKLGALQTQNTMGGGKATFQGSYAALVSEVGVETRRVKVSGEAQQALYDQNVAARGAVSGVNLDEEAANLIKYQQAYQASAKAFDIASKLFDVLLGIG